MNRKKTNIKPIWDDPNGLGWQLWRRVHTTGLLRPRIRRDNRRMHRNMFIARASLMKDIHRRWGLNQRRAFGGYNLSFPLVIARFPLVSPDTQLQELSAPSEVQLPLRPASMPVSPSLLSGLSKTSKSAEALGKLHMVQRGPALVTGRAGHGPKKGIDFQKLDGPAESEGYYDPEVPERTPEVQTSGRLLSPQRSKPAPADKVNATETDTGKAIEATHPDATKEVNLQRSAQSVLSRSAPAVVEATSKKKTPETRPVASMHPYGRRTDPSTSNQNTPSSQSPISWGNQSYGVQPFPAYPASNLLSNTIRQQPMLFPRYDRKSTLTPSAVAGQTGVVVSRSKAGVGSQLFLLGPVALYSGASKTPLHRKITDRLGRIRGSDELMPVILRSSAAGIASTVTAPDRLHHPGHPSLLHGLKPAGQKNVLSPSSLQSPYPITVAQTAIFSNTPLSKSVSSGPKKGKTLTVVAATGRWAMRSGASSRRLQGHRDPTAFLTLQSHLQALPLTGSRSQVDGKKVLPTSPLLYSTPAASMIKATRSAKESLSHVAGGRNAAPAAFTVPDIVATNPDRGKAQLIRLSGLIQTPSHGDDLMPRVISRATAIGTILANGLSGRQGQYKESGRRHAANDTEAVASRSGVHQIIESMAANRSTLHRQQYNPDTAHLQSDKHADAGTGRGAGEPRRAPETTPLTQLHQGRTTYLHHYAPQPMAATGPFLATSGLASLLRMTAETTYGAMRLPMSASIIMQRQVAGHTKTIENGFPLSSIKDSAGALSAVGRTGAAVPETRGDPSSLRLNFAADPLNTSFSGFESGHNLFRRPVGRPMVMQTVANREASQAAGTDRPPDQSSEWRTALLRQAVYTGLILRRAAGKDTRSGGLAAPEISIPMGAWFVMPELSRSLPLQLLTSRNKASPAPMMDKPSHERNALFRKAVYPGLILRLATGDDTRSGGPATPEISPPIGASPVTLELSRSQPLKLLTSRHAASPAPMIAKTHNERTAQLRQAVYPGLILRRAAGKDTRSGGPAAPEISTFNGAWPVIPELSRSLPLQLQTRRNETPNAPLMGRTSHEMPLFFMSGTESRNSSIANHHIGRPVIQTSPRQLLGAPATAITSAAVPSVVNEETAVPETETSAAQARIDHDELVEKVWQKIMRKLTIEQERKGCPRWR